MIEKYTLDNGLKVVLNSMPFMKSVSIGIFIKSGSVYETFENNGIAHFIEHMLFKGTKNRTARQISEESDEMGGTLNAYTGEECTCLYMKVLSSDVSEALELLFDVACNPVFDEDAIENEKKVILEEIASADDNPEDAAQEMLMSNMFRNHPVGMPVLGNAKNVMSFKKRDIRAFYDERYTAGNMVLSISGNFDVQNVKNIISNSDIAKKQHGTNDRINTYKAEICPGVYYSRRDIGQLQLVAGYPCVSRYDEHIYAFVLLSGILCGDGSSRLFRRLREENGLVYNVDASAMEYADTGVFMINTGFSAENTDKVISVMKNEIMDILQNGAEEAELARAKRNMSAASELESESTMSMMSILGKRMLYNIDLTSDEIRQKYMNVTNEDIKEAAKIAFADKTKEAVAVVGDGDGIKRFSILA